MSGQVLATFSQLIHTFEYILLLLLRTVSIKVPGLAVKEKKSYEAPFYVISATASSCKHITSSWSDRPELSRISDTPCDAV